VRWILYFILAYLILGLQVGLKGFISFQGASPNLVILAAIFIALNAPREPALLGTFVMGLMHDLLTDTPLGLYAFSYALVGMFVVSTQEIVYREHPLTHFSLALVGQLITSVVLLVQGLLHPPPPPIAILLLSSLYTAVLAPIVLFLLQRIRRVFAFQPAHRRIRPWKR